MPVAQRSSQTPNPYYSAFTWWFEDAGREFGPYETQSEALKALLEQAVKRETWLQRQKEKSKQK